MKYIYISGIILLIYYFYKKFRHKLRAIDIHRRYCTFGMSNKLIHSNNAIKLMIENDLKVKKNINQFIKMYDVNKMTTFLNKNFSDIQFFLNKYMDWICNTPHKHIICISNTSMLNGMVPVQKYNNSVAFFGGNVIKSNGLSKLFSVFLSPLVYSTML